ncbi:MAG TPA: AAA family ATPase [Candidatus Paceibacterota bacterium]|nr:AAA family ATPase [Candidatus Paceibacterota bacterium]
MNAEEIKNVRSLAKHGTKTWVNWRFVEREGKKTKVPYTPQGAMASSTNPELWSTYEEVVEAVGGFDGIGIVFNGDLLGIDLDHCIREDGSLPPEIEEIVKAAKTYTEVSPSGTGLHLYLRLTERMELTRNRSGNYECYTSGRFFTVTGKAWKVSSPIRTVTPHEAFELLKILGYPWSKKSEDESKYESAAKIAKHITQIEDRLILESMFTSKNGAKIKALYEGDISEYEGDDSRADSALCAHLAFWLGADFARVEAAWLESPLGSRDKTQDRPDYRKRTIDNALALTKETYKGEGKTRNPKTPHTGDRKALLTSFADIHPKPVDWLWPGRIARGKVTLIVGDPGISKSLVTVSLAATSSVGAPWPVDGVPAPLGDVVFISAEDDPADTIRPRLDAAGVDASRVHILQSVLKTNGDGTQSQRMFSLQEDVETLAEVLASLPNPVLVIIDPISAYMGGSNSHNNTDVRGLLAPLSEVAARFGVALVAVSHLNKDGTNKNPMYRAMGSLAFVAAARACFVVVRDKDNTDRRLMLPVKNNIAADTLGLAYSVNTAANGMPMIEWEKDAIVVPRDEMLADSEPIGKQSETELALKIIKGELASGPKTAKEMWKVAHDNFISDKCFRSAREKLGIDPVKTGFSDGWVWELPGYVPAQEPDEEDVAEVDRGEEVRDLQ